MLVHQQTHQLHHGDGRMGVIELDRHPLRQCLQVAVQAQVALQQILQRGRHQEIFLAQTQFLPGLGVVGRIEHAGDAFGPHLAGHRAEVIAGIETVELQVFLGARAP